MFKSSKSSKKGGMCTVCTAGTTLIGALAVICTVAAMIGVYKAHMLSSGLTFGTTSASLALVALAFHLFLLKKMMCCCPCRDGMKK